MGEGPHAELSRSMCIGGLELAPYAPFAPRWSKAFIGYNTYRRTRNCHLRWRRFVAFGRWSIVDCRSIAIYIDGVLWPGRLWKATPCPSRDPFSPPPLLY